MTPHVVLGTATCGSFTVTEFVQPAGLHVPPHEHAAATLAIVLGGAMVDVFTGSSISLDPGAAITRPFGERHAHRYGARGVHCLAVSVSQDGLRRLDGVTSLFSAVRHFRTGVSARGILAEIGATDSVRELALEARVLEIVVDLSRRPAPAAGCPPSWLARVRDLVHDDPAACRSLGRLAREAGVHEGHLARAFRAHYGCSIGTYTRARRVELAADQLTTSDLPISEVAANAGFYDQSHFTRIFRKVLGTTPAQWRKRRG